MIPLADAQARARNIKVLIFDVDGVLTDGTFSFIPNPDGTASEIKPFSAHDGLGISLARLGGIRTGIITKRVSQTVATRARDLKLEFVYQGQSHKRSAAEAIAKAAGITMEEMCYVGDDIVDLPVMRLCGLAIATANARPQVLAAAHWINAAPRRRRRGARCDRFPAGSARLARARHRAVPRCRRCDGQVDGHRHGKYVGEEAANRVLLRYVRCRSR